MTKLYELLIEIKKRPGLYLGRKSLQLLDAFLGGYSVCCQNYGNEDTNIFNGFQEFIQERFKITSTQSWAKIIDFFCISDEEAFDRFYKLFEEFLKKQNKELEEVKD